jgi:hypothetical protein
MKNCKDCENWEKSPFHYEEGWGTCFKLDDILEINFDTEQDCDYAVIERIMTPAMFGCPHFERRK